MNKTFFTKLITFLFMNYALIFSVQCTKRHGFTQNSHNRQNSSKRTFHQKTKPRKTEAKLREQQKKQENKHLYRNVKKLEKRRVRIVKNFKQIQDDDKKKAFL